MAARKRKTATTKTKEQFIVGISSCGGLSQLYTGDTTVHNTLDAAKNAAADEAVRLASDAGEDADDCTVYIMKVAAQGESERKFAWK